MTTEDLMLDRFFGGSANQVASASVRDSWSRLSDVTPAPLLVDVREPAEFKQGRAKGAKNIPLSQLGRRMQEIPHDRDILLICRSGQRSMQAANFLKQHGWTRLTNVAGGTLAWQRHGLPME
jgi:rhodanese-related sulfurtransferase